jgi:hypothetical protein
MTKHKRQEECGIIGFIRRLLFKMSGQKIVCAGVSALLIYFTVWARHEWSAEITDALAFHVITAIKAICLALFGSNVALSGLDIIKGNPHDANGDGSK